MSLKYLSNHTLSFFEVYQEAREEGKQQGRFQAKLEAIPRLLALGLTVEQIAQALDLDITQVQQVEQQVRRRSQP